MALEGTTVFIIVILVFGIPPIACINEFLITRLGQKDLASNEEIFLTLADQNFSVKHVTVLARLATEPG